MINSMTGFGRATGRVQNREVNVELRSVNNRFREVSVRMPRSYSVLEEQVKKIVAERIIRGRIDVSIQVDESMERRKKMKIDLDLARTIHQLLLQLKGDLALDGHISLSDLTQYKDIIKFEEEEQDLTVFIADLTPLMTKALDKLIEMRKTEGQALATDLAVRLTQMSVWVTEIESRRELVIQDIKSKLEARIKAMTNGIELDQGRLAQEVALLVDRADVTEEVVRLRSHFEQFQSRLTADGAGGRRLEFLLQEINREVNTIGSKSSDTTITNLVVGLKTELEKIREQLQNVE